MPIKLHIDEDWDQFNILGTGYEVIQSKENFVVDSDKIDGAIYIKTNRASWFSCKPNVIDMTREHDLDMLESVVRAGIATPHYMYVNNAWKLFRNMQYGKEYMLKSFDSARSVGQVKCTKESIHEILDDALHMTPSDFNDKHNIDVRTARDDSERYYLHTQIKSHNVYVSEVVDFSHEYRVLYFEGTQSNDFIVKERFGYQVGSDIARKNHVVDSSAIDAEILFKIKEFGDNHPSPMLSFDVYILPDGGWGVFEYSTQFALDNTGYYEQVQGQMDRALKHAINRVIK